MSQSKWKDLVTLPLPVSSFICLVTWLSFLWKNKSVGQTRFNRHDLFRERRPRTVLQFQLWGFPASAQRISRVPGKPFPSSPSTGPAGSLQSPLWPCSLWPCQESRHDHPSHSSLHLFLQHTSDSSSTFKSCFVEWGQAKELHLCLNGVEPLRWRVLCNF